MEVFYEFVSNLSFSVYIFSLMLFCWIIITASKGSYLREKNSHNSENILQRILEAISFVAFIGGLIWGFMNLQWDFVIALLVIMFLASFGVLSLINSFTGYKDPHVFFIRFREYFDGTVFLCFITLWMIF